MHREMDKRGLRWRNDRKNEPFKPKRTVDELIACTRYEDNQGSTRDEFEAQLDTRYRGERRQKDNTILLNERTTQEREVARETKAPILDIRLNKSNIDQKKFNLLLDRVGNQNTRAARECP